MNFNKLSNIKQGITDMSLTEKLSGLLPKLPFAEIETILAAFASPFTQDARFITFQLGDGSAFGDRLLPHSIEGREELSTQSRYIVTCVSPDAYIPLEALEGLAAQIGIATTGGGTIPGKPGEILRCGLVTHAEILPSDGGFAKYRLTIETPLALLAHRTSNRVFQDIKVHEIAQQILEEHITINPAIAAILKTKFVLRKQYNARSYCIQYRESDLDFINRIMAEEGMSYRWVHDGGETPTCQLTVFDDPYDLPQATQPNVRFHRAEATETADSLVEWTESRSIGPSHTRMSSYDYKPVQTHDVRVEGRSEHNSRDRSENLRITAESSLEDFDAQTHYYGKDNPDVMHYVTLRQDVHDRKKSTYKAAGNLRQLIAGEWFCLTGHPLYDRLPEAERGFVACELEFSAHNNLPAGLGKYLPKNLLQRVLPQSADAGADDTPPYWVRLSLRRRGLPLSPAYGHTRHARPTAPGIQTATVTGPGNEVVYTDSMGRVKIQFHWQRKSEHTQFGANFDERSSCWVRVAYPSAGLGFGNQYIPRIGQEVLVDFIEGDIDRPIITNAVHNGKQATPRFSGVGLLPANRALNGIRTQEHHGQQYGELLFDDTTHQVRSKLSSEHGKTQLNQGFLIHPRFNGVGEPRGEGAELRTDRQAAIRAAEGLLLTTEAKLDATGRQLDREAAQAQLEAARTSAKELAEAAAHQTADALEIGPATRDDEGAEQEDSPKGHLEHMVEAIKAWESGTNTDLEGKSATKDQPGRQAVLLASGVEGIGLTTPREMVLSSGCNLDTISQRDTQQTTLRRWLHNAGKKISFFVHGIKDRINLRMITAKGHALLHAQSGDVEIAGDQNLKLYAVNKQVLVAAGKEIVLTSGGAYIRLKDGNIEFHCPGLISFRCANQSCQGPAQMEVPFPKMPKINIDPFPFKLDLRLVDIPGPNGHAIAHVPWKIVKPRMLADFTAGLVDPEDVLVEGTTDDEGRVKLTKEQEDMLGEHYFKSPGCLWISYAGHCAQLNVEPESPEWSKEEQLMRALAALGYSDEVQRGSILGTSPSDIERVGKLTGYKNPNSLLKDWKKGS